RTGVTGVQDSLSGAAGPLAASMREVTRLPLAVGFGISTPEHVRQVGEAADAAVVGSAFVRLIGRSAGVASLPLQIETMARELKHGFEMKST
ncbi:MAG TPA: tryptophan synthase subunit alpha, partial [Bryobacteraceae bacterium]|nr:tryptophan synthase subunit alpha [Bryobacteraceae bacterium]